MIFTLFAVLLTITTIENVEVEFVIVDVPRYYTPLNENIYISGTFNDWSPNSTHHKLIRLTHNQFKIHLNLDQGLHEYRFTRGSLNSIETELNGSNIRSRKLRIESPSTPKQTINVRVNNWKDMAGDHTATGNVFFIKNMPYPQFNDTTDVWIYLPTDYYYTNKTYSVIYMPDGRGLFDKFFDPFGQLEELGFDEIMENYVRQGKEASIIVGLATPYPRRHDELTPYPNSKDDYPGGKVDLFLDFMLNTVKPFVDLHYRTKPGRDHTGVYGLSLGGVFSFYAGIKHQHVFSKIFVTSGWFSYNTTIYNLAANTPLKYNNTKFYFLAGSGEINEEYNVDLVSEMMKVVNILFDKGYKNNIKYVVATDGVHKGWFWSREFPAQYEWLFHS